jgi:integrase
MESPCRIERATVYRSREQNTPTEAEVAIILDSASSDDARAALALIAYGGLRPSEALALRRKDLSTIERGDESWRVVNVSRSLSWLTGGRVEIKDTKSSEGVRSLVLPKLAEELLSKHLDTVPDKPEALIFSKDSDGREPWVHQALHRKFQGPKKVAGYEGTLYSLRHYHLTSYAMTGATLKEIMQRGGHSSIEAAMRYQRAAGRDLELVERLG